MSNISSFVFPVFGFLMVISYISERKILGEIITNYPVKPLPKFIAGIPVRLSGLKRLSTTTDDSKALNKIRAFRFFRKLDIVSLATCLFAFAYDFTNNVLLR